MKDPERIPLEMEVRNYTLEASAPNQRESQINGIGSVQQCYTNNSAQDDREQEKKVARKRLYWASFVCSIFIIGEVIGGYFASSLAVMTDAAHLMVDLLSFIISLISLWLSSKPATQKLSFGWHRAEILGALLSILSIWLVTGVLVYLAVLRLINNQYKIEGTIMLITSACAVLANIIMALILHQSGHGHSHGGLSSHGHGHSHGGSSSNGHAHSNEGPRSNGHAHSHGGPSSNGQSHENNEKHALSNDDHANLEQNGADKGRRTQQANASVRAAFVHVVGDLLQSISVLVSAIIIYFKPEYKIADPICTFLFSIFVLFTTFTILRDIVLVLMEGTPGGVKYDEVQNDLLAVKGVKEVHSLYIWALTMNQALLSAHIVIDESVDSDATLREITQACSSSYTFHSVTVQIEKQNDLKPV